MGWNPQFNFSLRDDEVTFGTLIFDKQCAELLCAELLKIKNGTSSSIENIKSILDAGCFTDDELTETRYEFEQVKEDIRVFSQFLRTYQKFATWWDTTATKASYIVGSTTWYRQFIDMKSMAADMYLKLLNSNHLFEPADKAEYDKRYSEIIQNTNLNERTELAIRRQFEQNLANGVENAREIYQEAMVTAGLMSKEQVEAQNILLRASDASSVEVTMKPLADDEVFVDYALLKSLWVDVLQADNENVIADVGDTILPIITMVLKTAKLDKYVKQLENIQKQRKFITVADYINTVDEWFDLLNTAEVIDALKANDIRWKIDYLNEVRDQIERSIVVNDTLTDTDVNVALIKDVYKAVTEIQNEDERAEAEIRLIDEVCSIAEQAGIKTAFWWQDACINYEGNKDIPNMVKVHKAAENAVNCVEYSANVPLIDSVEYRVNYDWKEFILSGKQ